MRVLYPATIDNKHAPIQHPLLNVYCKKPDVPCEPMVLHPDAGSTLEVERLPIRACRDGTDTTAGVQVKTDVM